MLPPAVGAARSNRARPPHTRTLPPRRPSTAGRGSRGLQEGWSVKLHSQKRAHNPPRGPQTEAFHWSVRRDVTETELFYRQVAGDAIKKSLSDSAKDKSVLATLRKPPNFSVPSVFPECQDPSSQLHLVTHQSFTQPHPSNLTPVLWPVYFFKYFLVFPVIAPSERDSCHGCWLGRIWTS